MKHSRAFPIRCILLTIILLCFISTFLYAQTATVRGKVTDAETQEALPGANVVVRSAETETGAAVQSNGEFTVRNLPPGTYTITVSYIGYEEHTISSVVLSEDETRTINIELNPTGLELNPISITASRRPEKSLDAPASISVLEPREITQVVAPSSSSTLRNVTGVDMSETGIDRYEIVLRGFNNAFSGATYVLTDNRQAAVASLGVNIHSIMPNMAIDLEKVEIVRGAGSALYGAGVDAGVIHYITKDPFDYPGTTVTFSGGERSTFAGAFRHAGVVNNNLGYKITGQYAQANDWKLDPNNPQDQEQLNNDAPGLKRDYDYKKLNVNGMLKYRFSNDVSLTANGGYSTLDAIVLSGIGTVQGDGFGYSYGQLRLQANHFFAQTYINRNNAGDSFVYGTGDTVVDHSTLFNVQAQYDLQMADGRQQFIFGVDYDRTTPKTDGKIYGRNENRDLISETGAYAQSQTAISPKIDLTLALRGDYNNLQKELQLSPRVAAVLKPNPQNSFRVSYNRAFASPGNNSNFLDIVAREPDAQLPIQIRGRGSAFGFTFGRNPAFEPFAGSDLIAYSLNPATLGQPQPVGLPLDATYAAVYAGLSQLPPAVIRALLPPQLQGLTDQQIQGLVALLNPSLTMVNGFSQGALGLLNATTGAINPIDDVTDIEPLQQTITQTIEAGYKGLIKEKVLFAVDLYYTNKKDFVGPLLMETPFVLVPSLSADLTAALSTGIQNNATLAAQLQQLGLPPDQVAALIVGLAQSSLPSATTPVAIVAPNENAPQPGEAPELLLAYRNFGNINLWGVDVNVQVAANDRLTLFGNLSVVSDNFFNNKELDESGTDLSLALNAPTFKTKVGFSYNIPNGFSANASGRYIKGFPVLSGPYVGDVGNYFLLDIGAGYDFGRYAPGMRLDFLIQNALDNSHREFIGAPEIGRLALARLTYSF